VADEGTGGVAGSKLPETERLIPGRGESVGTVRRDDLYSIRDKSQPEKDVHTQSETIWE
jgi:hypothetical protein